MLEHLDSHIEPLTEKEALSQLIEQIYGMIGNPISTWAVAATIESLGIRDVDARSDFGYESVFELAEVVYERIKQRIKEEEEGVDQEASAQIKLNIGGFKQALKLFFKHYSFGLVFSLPMLSQFIAIVFFEYALWAWFDFNEAQATAVAFGTIVSFIVTGGFIQALGRLVSRYKGEGNFYLAQKAYIGLMKIAIPVVFLVAALILGVNLILPFYPQPLILLSMIYMVMISLLLLAAAILFATEQRLMIFIGIVMGTILVIIGMDVIGIGIYLSQWIGIMTATVIMFAYSTIYFRFKIRTLRQELFKQSLPGLDVNYYNTYRYFIYGLSYFAFLFMDRIMAWSAGPPPPEYIIWFNTPYELGMDWALISLVISIALLEFSVHAFSVNLIPAQKNAFISRLDLFNKYFRRFYRRQLFFLVIVGALSILFTYYGVLSLRVFESEIPELADFFQSPITFMVFWWASIAYVFLILGLMNSLFFFTLNRPEMVMYCMVGALFVNFIVGYLCSRLLGLEYAVVGLMAGSIVFAVATGLLARRFFKHLDYFYYSAY